MFYYYHYYYYSGSETATYCSQCSLFMHEFVLICMNFDLVHREKMLPFYYLSATICFSVGPRYQTVLPEWL